MKINKQDIIKILAKFGKISPDVSNNYNFIESGFIDSINILKFITDIEKKYKLSLNNEYINSKKFGEIGDLIKKINQIKKNK